MADRLGRWLDLDFAALQGCAPAVRVRPNNMFFPGAGGERLRYLLSSSLSETRPPSADEIN